MIRPKHTPLRIGGIGCGPMSVNTHYPAIQQNPELELVAVCDLDEERLNAATRKFHLKQKYSDFIQMLDECELDAVSIVGPPSLHVLAGQECQRRQIPFMTEKPLAESVAEARELARLAEKLGNCGQVGYTIRFGPAIRMGWEISRSPKFGKITYVATSHLIKATMRPTWNKADPVEAFVNLHGVHAIDLWRFFGGDPDRVTTHVVYGDANEKSPQASILVFVEKEDGPHGIIHMKAGASHSGDINADIMGVESRLRIEDLQTITYEHSQDWASEIIENDLLKNSISVEHLPVGQYINAGQMARNYDDYFKLEWAAFARAILDGRPFSPTIEDGFRTVCLTEAICQSLHQGGKSVLVNYDK